MERKLLPSMFSLKMGVGLLFITLILISLTFLSSVIYPFENTLMSNQMERISVGPHSQSLRTPSSKKYRKFGVATENEICSEMGKSILKQGGNAIDAAVSTTICIGTVNSFSSGIGGGGFMIVRLPDGSKEYVDFREIAPKKAFKNMFDNLPLNSSRIGGLSVAVPGELKGLHFAWKKWGSMNWSDLLKPNIKLAREGFRVGKNLAKRLVMYQELMIKSPAFRKIFTRNGRILKEGELLFRRKYADTLEEIALAGNVEPFYNGRIGERLVEFIKSKGGIMEMDDLRQYTVNSNISKVLHGTFNEYKVYAVPPPASGNIIITIMNMLESSGTITYHQFVEILKFGYGIRLQMGDPDYNSANLSNWVAQTMSKEYAKIVIAKIDLNSTHMPDYYLPMEFAQSLDHGTTHISILDENDMAVSLTSTINLIFGSQLLDPETGIILNDQMDDFSIPNRTNYFGYPPSPKNFIAPGKRPQSSAAPVLLEKNDKPFIVTGASGGSYIISSVINTILNLIVFGMDASSSVHNPRLHHQLLPNILFAESNFNQTIIDGLKNYGHNISFSDAQSAVQLVIKDNDNEGRPFIDAVSDSRKNGVASGE